MIVPRINWLGYLCVLLIAPLNVFAQNNQSLDSERLLGTIWNNSAIEIKGGLNYVDFYGPDTDNEEVLSRFRLCSSINYIGTMAGLIGFSAGYYLHRNFVGQLEWARTCA